MGLDDRILMDCMKSPCLYLSVCVCNKFDNLCCATPLASDQRQSNSTVWRLVGWGERARALAEAELGPPLTPEIRSQSRLRLHLTAFFQLLPRFRSSPCAKLSSRTSPSIGHLVSCRCRAHPGPLAGTCSPSLTWGQREAPGAAAAFPPHADFGLADSRREFGPLAMMSHAILCGLPP